MHWMDRRNRTPRTLAAALLLAACSSPDTGAPAGEPAPPPNATEVPPPSVSAAMQQPATPAVDWTAGDTDRPAAAGGMATLTAVRIARNSGHDRVVFEFPGNGLPGYHIEYVDRPVRQCGSGEVVELAGDGWLEIRMEPAQAHDEQGRATITERALAPGLPVIREAKLTCDFEGQVTWVLGVASPNPYRVLELAAPPRLVVDVRH